MRAFLLLATLAAIPVLLYSTDALAAEREKPFVPVANLLKERAGALVRWQQDGAARMESLQNIRALLALPLTASTATRIALLNNRDLLATYEEIGISAADLREAGLWKNPRFDLVLRFPDRPPSAVDSEESLVFNFLDLLMLPMRKRVAADHLAAVQLRVADEALKLVAEVKSAIYTLQAGEQLLGRLKTLQEASGAALELAQDQHKAGNIADLTLLEQQTVYSQSRLDVAMADAELRANREKINRLLGLWGEQTGWKVSESLPAMPPSDPPLRGLESLAILQRLDLSAARSELAGIVRGLGLVKAYRLFGALDVGGDTEHNPDRSRVTGPTLGVELPIFNQGQARLARGEAALRAAEWKYEGLAIEIRSEARELSERLAGNREMAAFYHDDLLPGRWAIVNQTQLSFNGMLVGNYVLFEAKADELRAERGYIESLRDYWITRAELERAVGGSFTSHAISPVKEVSPRSSKSKQLKHNQP